MEYRNRRYESLIYKLGTDFDTSEIQDKISEKSEGFAEGESTDDTDTSPYEMSRPQEVYSDERIHEMMTALLQ